MLPCSRIHRGASSTPAIASATPPIRPLFSCFFFHPANLLNFSIFISFLWGAPGHRVVPASQSSTLVSFLFVFLLSTRFFFFRLLGARAGRRLQSRSGHVSARSSSEHSCLDPLGRVGANRGSTRSAARVQGNVLPPRSCLLNASSPGTSRGRPAGVARRRRQVLARRGRLFKRVLQLRFTEPCGRLSTVPLASVALLAVATSILSRPIVALDGHTVGAVCQDVTMGAGCMTLSNLLIHRGSFAQKRLRTLSLARTRIRRRCPKTF